MAPLFSALEHIALSARSPEALADWYVKMLGFELFTSFDNGKTRPRTYMLRLGGQGPFLEIFAAESGYIPRERQNSDMGLVHLAVLVSDFNAAVELLFKQGVRPEGDEREGARGARVRFYRDPEGNLFHVIWRPSPLQP